MATTERVCPADAGAIVVIALLVLWLLQPAPYLKEEIRSSTTAWRTD